MVRSLPCADCITRGAIDEALSPPFADWAGRMHRGHGVRAAASRRRGQLDDGGTRRRVNALQPARPDQHRERRQAHARLDVLDRRAARPRSGAHRRRQHAVRRHAISERRLRARPDAARSADQVVILAIPVVIVAGRGLLRRCQSRRRLRERTRLLQHARQPDDRARREVRQCTRHRVHLAEGGHGAWRSRRRRRSLRARHDRSRRRVAVADRRTGRPIVRAAHDRARAADGRRRAGCSCSHGRSRRASGDCRASRGGPSRLSRVHLRSPDSGRR